MPSLDPAFVELLAAPGTRERLELADGELRDANGRRFPTLGGVADLTGRGSANEGVETGFAAEQLDALRRLEDWHFWFVGRRALIAQLVDRYAGPRQELLLDVGCGSGSIVRLLAARGHRVVGLDTDAESLAAVAKRDAGAWLVAGDATRLPFGDETFDGVLALDVLEHVQDRAAAAEIRRVLKPGGWFLVAVPAMPWLWSAVDEVAGHLRRYTRRTLRELLAASAFRVESVRYYQFTLFPLIAATRLLGRRGSAWRVRERRPSAAANRIFTALTRAEVRAGRVVPWPWGSSLVAFARTG